MNQGNIFLSFSRNRFENYKKMAENAVAELKDEELFLHQSNAAPDEEGDNSIAVIMQHLAGNMLSRWTNFMTEDGEKKWRLRDTEFEKKHWLRSDLMTLWEKGWSCLFDALDEINMDNLDSIILIRNEEHTITEAILRQLTHYAYHVGQIVHIAKLLRGNEWKSLSIPKNKSVEYNQDKPSPN